MKTGVNLAKIVSTSIALILCSAVLAFALTALGWGAASPAHANPATCTPAAPSVIISTSQGAAGSSVTVTGSGVQDANGTAPCPLLATGTATIEIGLTNCSSSTIVTGNAGTLSISNGYFSGPFTWPSGDNSTTSAYHVCVALPNYSSLVDAGGFTVTSSSSTTTSTLVSSPSSGGSGTTITVSGPSTAATGTTISVNFGYSTDTADTACNPFSSVSTATPTVTNGAFSGTFSWPSGLTVGTTYMVCAQINGVTEAASTFLNSTSTSSSSSTGSVSVDNSSYTVGGSMTVTLSGFPANTSVSLTVQTSGGSNGHSLNSVTTDSTGASTTVHSAPSSPTGTVEIVANAGSVTATSSTFTIKAKTTAKPKSAPAPAPAAAPPPPAPVYYPPAAQAATPTPVPTDTPTPVPTDTPTPVPTPTVAPIPTAVPVSANTNTGFLGGKVPLALAIGLGALIALGLLFVIGRLLLGKFLSPTPEPDMSPGAAIPWLDSQGNSSQGNAMMNGIPLAQTMPFDNSFPPGNGGFAPGYGPPQQVPFGSGTGTFSPVPADGGFAPGPGNSPQPVPIGGPYQPGTSGFAPANANEQEPFPPSNWFGSPN
jgi:hypothetical protein